MRSGAVGPSIAGDDRTDPEIGTTAGIDPQLSRMLQEQSPIF
jgi:hypothetical protein